MSEEGLWKQIEDIISASDFKANFEDALSRGDINRCRDLYLERVDRQLGKSFELTDNLITYTKKLFWVCHALYNFIDERKLITEFEQWLMQNKQFEQFKGIIGESPKQHKWEGRK